MPVCALAYVANAKLSNIKADCFHKLPTTQTQVPGDTSAVTLMAHKVG